MRKILSLLLIIGFLFLMFGCDNKSNPEEKHTHEFSTSLSYDEVSHWYDCSCGEKKNTNPHTWGEGKVIKEATEQVPGEIKYTCSECGKVKSEEIAKLTHNHTFESWVNEVKATCTTNGKKGYRYCSSCEKYYDENLVEINFEDLAISAIGHQYVAVDAKSPSCSKDGNIGHLACENCDSKMVINGEDVTIAANSEWNDAYPFGNFTGSPAYITTDGVNTFLKIKPADWYPTQTGFTKDTGSRLSQAGTYVLSFDIKGSATTLNAIHRAKLDIHFNYNDVSFAISDGISNLTIVTTEWTTLTFEFTVPAGINSDFTNLSFYYWAEDTLSDNYLLIDNLIIYAKDDETKTNLDTLGKGDFEGYIAREEVDDVGVSAGHKLGDLIAEVAATCTQVGMKKHYQCITCNRYFDESKNEVGYNSLIIGALGGEHDYDGLVLEVAATCEKSGLKAHYKCDNCETYFDSDENEVTYESLILEVKDHNYIYEEANNLMCIEGGHIGHQKCTYCGKTFGFTENKIALAAHSQWSSYPYGNWTDQEIEIINDNGNTCMRIDPIAWYPNTIGFKKELSTSILKAGKYRLLIDVKAGPNENSTKGKLDLFLIYNGGKIVISENAFNLSSTSRDNWTTLEFAFTMPSGISSTYLNLDGYYWPEVSLGANYILIDNIKIVKADDETNTNLEVFGFNDFEGLLAKKEIDDVANHQWGEGIVTKEATETETGIKTYYCQYCDATKTKEYVFGLPESIKILGIGNSYTDDSFTRLYDVLSSLGYENVTVGLMIIGGSSLEDHWKNFSNDNAAYEYRLNINGIQTTTLKTKASDVLAEEWDYVLFNQLNVFASSGNYAKIDEYIGYIKNHQPSTTKIVFNMTWSNVDTSVYGTNHLAYYKDIVKHTQEIVAPRDDVDFIIHNGTAIQNVRNATGEELLRDGLHLDLYYGRFIASLTIAKYISGVDISVVDYPASITPEQFEIAVKAVNAAYENNYEITDLN